MITALFAATIAVAQNDIKKVLAYSTVSQLGYMFLAVGSGAYVAAIFHMITHAFFKALLFLGAGSVIHGMHDEQDMRRMGGCASACRSPRSRSSSAGWPSPACRRSPASGRRTRSCYPRSHKSPALYAIGLFTALLTAYYMSRQVFMVFFGEAQLARTTPSRARRPRRAKPPRVSPPTMLGRRSSMPRRAVDRSAACDQPAVSPGCWPSAASTGWLGRRCVEFGERRHRAAPGPTTTTSVCSWSSPRGRRSPASPSPSSSTQRHRVKGRTRAPRHGWYYDAASPPSSAAPVARRFEAPPLVRPQRRRRRGQRRRPNRARTGRTLRLAQTGYVRIYAARWSARRGRCCSPGSSIVRGDASLMESRTGFPSSPRSCCCRSSARSSSR